MVSEPGYAHCTDMVDSACTVHQVSPDDDILDAFVEISSFMVWPGISLNEGCFWRMPFSCRVLF